MCWRQPDAVRENPDIQRFLRGPDESFIFRNFEGLPKARAFVNKHEKQMNKQSGCKPYFTVALGDGKGKSAFGVLTETTVLVDAKKAEYLPRKRT